jgi:hypothetical protein
VLFRELGRKCLGDWLLQSAQRELKAAPLESSWIRSSVTCRSWRSRARPPIGNTRSLARVIAIAIFGVVAGVSGPTGIATLAAIRADALWRLVPLPNAVPRKAVSRRPFNALKPGIFQACFSDSIETMRETAAEGTGEDRPVLAVDGKTLRRSHDRLNGVEALHTVSG